MKRSSVQEIGKTMPKFLKNPTKNWGSSPGNQIYFKGKFTRLQNISLDQKR